VGGREGEREERDDRRAHVKLEHGHPVISTSSYSVSKSGFPEILQVKLMQVKKGIVWTKSDKTVKSLGKQSYPDMDIHHSFVFILMTIF